MWASQDSKESHIIIKCSGKILEQLLRLRETGLKTVKVKACAVWNTISILGLLGLSRKPLAFKGKAALLDILLHLLSPRNLN